MSLSVIVVAHDMERELPRTLQSLTRDYQGLPEDLDYEVLVVDNGSRRSVASLDLECPGAELRIVAPEVVSPSPACAINAGLHAARGDVLCLMIDGAHLLTPGVLRWTLRAFAAFDEPVVAVRYFYLGPGDQPDTMREGYDRTAEDRLLAEIAWPDDGYRLFEIGAALRGSAPGVTWLNRVFESNCLGIRRDLAVELGGMDEAFDLPGGGFVNLDFFKRACEREGTALVELIGEGSFHQVHGGTTTNSDTATRRARLEAFRKQYLEVRGHAELTTSVPLHFLGHLPSEDAKIHRYRYGRRARSC